MKTRMPNNEYAARAHRHYYVIDLIIKIFGMIDQFIPNTEPCKKGPTYDTTSKMPSPSK